MIKEQDIPNLKEIMYNRFVKCLLTVNCDNLFLSKYMSKENEERPARSIEAVGDVAGKMTLVFMSHFQKEKPTLQILNSWIAVTEGFLGHSSNNLVRSYMAITGEKPTFGYSKHDEETQLNIYSHLINYVAYSCVLAMLKTKEI